MDRVYIMSRYRAATEKEQEFNREVARYFAKQITYEGKVPVAPHLFYTQFLNDAIPGERENGLKFGIFDLRASQEFLLVVIDGIISEGIQNQLFGVMPLFVGDFISVESFKIAGRYFSAVA